MKKNFLKFALCLVLATALLSLVFSVIYFIASGSIDEGDTFLKVIYYVKKFFDLLAVFTGYAVIIFAFSRFDFKNGLATLVIFSASFLISFVFQVIGTCIYQKDFSADFISFTIYYAFGQCFITQMLPAIIIALIAHTTTKNGTKKITKLLDMSNPIQKGMLFTSLLICGINAVCMLIFDTIPFLIEYDFYISFSEFCAILFSYLEIIILYFVVEYIVYVIGYKICDSYVEKHTVVYNKEN